MISRKIGGDIFKRLVGSQVNGFNLQCFQEALRLGIVVGVASATHRTGEAMRGQQGAVCLRRVLRTSVGMVDAALGRVATSDGSREGSDSSGLRPMRSDSAPQIGIRITNTARQFAAGPGLTPDLAGAWGGGNIGSAYGRVSAAAPRRTYRRPCLLSRPHH